MWDGFGGGCVNARKIKPILFALRIHRPDLNQEIKVIPDHLHDESDERYWEWCGEDVDNTMNKPLKNTLQIFDWLVGDRGIPTPPL